MKFYWLPSSNRFVARQADIPKGDISEVIDVAIDQASLMDRLNRYEERLANFNCPVVDTVEEAETALAQGSGVAISVAAQQMRQLDVEDAIQRANATELLAYGSNVFDRFRDLHRELKNSETAENKN